MSNKKNKAIIFTSVLFGSLFLTSPLSRNFAMELETYDDYTKDNIKFQDDSPYGDETEVEEETDIEDEMETTETLNQWVESAIKAAASWEMDYNTFRAEAEKFLIAYKKAHPFSTYPSSVEDLIVLPKPDINATKKKLIEFNEFHSNKYLNEINQLKLDRVEHSPKFLVSMP